MKPHLLISLLLTAFLVFSGLNCDRENELSDTSTTEYKIKKCTQDTKSGEICQLIVTDIHPTQFSVGMLAVDCSKKRIQDMSKKKLKNWLSKTKRRIPTIIGPDGEFYITDRHHLATSLFLAKPGEDWKEKDKKLNLVITHNLYDQSNKLDMDEFWNNMLGRGYRNGMPGDTLRTWLYDEQATYPMDPRLIPDQMGDLLNDPYRTLSRWVREGCGYLKKGKTQCGNNESDAFYMEFYWANFLRKAVPINLSTEPICKYMPYANICLQEQIESLKSVYDTAMKEAISNNAKKYFTDLGLDPKVYGFNYSGKIDPVEIDTCGCDKKNTSLDIFFQEEIDLDEYYFEEH